MHIKSAMHARDALQTEGIGIILLSSLVTFFDAICYSHMDIVMLIFTTSANDADKRCVFFF